MEIVFTKKRFLIRGCPTRAGLLYHTWRGDVHRQSLRFELFRNVFSVSNCRGKGAALPTRSTNGGDVASSIEERSACRRVGYVGAVCQTP